MLKKKQGNLTDSLDESDELSNKDINKKGYNE